MTSSISTAAVWFIACHGGPADHFATYAEHLAKEGYNVQICASGPALKKFQDRGIKVNLEFSLDKLSSDEEDKLAIMIAKTCSSASVVFTDVGHAFDIKIQKALASYAEKTYRLAYYDNPELYVPGGYSLVAADVMLAAQGVVFANASLAKAILYKETGKAIVLGERKCIGLGYYPINQAEKIAKKRKEDQPLVRSQFLAKNGLNESEQKILVYFGGNNDEYFGKAFPAFLNILSKTSEKTDLSNYVVVLQQHPGAKAKNVDGELMSAWLKDHSKKKGAPKVIVSDFSSDDAQVLADAALYYQTSMGPQFVLSQIPVIQIGHEMYEDILVRNHLCASVSTPIHFIEVLDGLEKARDDSRPDVIFKSLGIRKDWFEVLKTTIKR